jgi:[protein-PII] uridylyltransferase
MRKNLKENLLYSKIFSEVISTRILYIAMFFHDLGKGMGKDHSIVSSEIAKNFCSHIEIDQTEKNIIVWLIRNHLLMNKISQKRDIDDSNIIFEFGKKVQSLEQLKLLFIFTVTDMKATGKTIWNAWNKYPLEQLFMKTRNLFLGSPINVNKKIIEAVKLKLKRDKNLYSRNKIENFSKVLPKEIYLNNDKKKIIKFLEIIQKSKQKTCIKIFQNKQKLATEIIIYTKDKPGLLYKLSGAVTVSGFNVVEAKISTLNNGMALDILWVRDLNGFMLDSLYHFLKLKKKILEILSNDNLLEEEIENEREKNLKKNLFNINTKIFIDNDSSKKHTILEINAFDRIGLIYDLTKKLYKLGFEISSAKILTLGKGANEIFYIQDFRGNKIISNKKIDKLKTSIMTLLKD